jgi:hypothetical protein
MATTYEDILNLFQETDRKFQATDRKFLEDWANAERRFQETERLLKEQSRETDRKIKEVTIKIGNLGNRLGEFVEGLVRPAVLRLFRERGIEVHEVYPDVEVNRHDGGLQIDLLVVNDMEAVLVEVKGKLTQADVDEHRERLGKFKRLMPRYAGVQALGAVAAMVVPQEVGRYAYRQGFFVLAQTGDNVVILNDAKFQPKAW